MKQIYRAQTRQDECSRPDPNTILVSEGGQREFVDPCCWSKNQENSERKKREAVLGLLHNRHHELEGSVHQTLLCNLTTIIRHWRSEDKIFGFS